MTAPSPAPWQRRVFLALSGGAAVLVILAAHSVLLPFVLALVVAYVLTPSVKRVETFRVPRWAAILLVYALCLGAVGLFVSQIVPRLVAEGRGLAEEWPKLTRDAREQWLPRIDAKLGSWSGQKPAPTELVPDDAGAEPEEPPPPFRLIHKDDGSYDVRVTEGVRFREKRDGVWEIEQIEKRKGISAAVMLREGFDKAVAYLQENSGEVLKVGREVIAAVSRGIFTLFMTLMLAGYMMLTHEKILAFFRGLVRPSARSSFDHFLDRLDRGLSGVVRGQLLICLVNGVLSAIGFWIFKLKYWPILSVVAAVMSLIPIFGSILSSVPAVAIGLTQSPATAFGVLAWIVGIHQIEANFLNPKIIGDAAKIHPVLVVFSLIAGEHFFQIPGALFAVPCLSIAQTVFLHFRDVTMPADEGEPPPPPRRSSSVEATLIPGAEPGATAPEPVESADPADPSKPAPPGKPDESAAPGSPGRKAVV
ncbi:MAG: AI-2E family transporter [Byssovorax sp.]